MRNIKTYFGNREKIKKIDGFILDFQELMNFSQCRGTGEMDDPCLFSWEVRPY